MIRLVFALMVAAVVVAFSSSAALAQSSPQFVLGFKALHDMIPDIVGQPLENQHFDPTTGDALQRTTNGLLVWRKADNITAFTNGSTSWLLGPDGLQSRPNNERFPWEPAQPPSPSPAPAPPAPAAPNPPATGATSPHPANWAGYVATSYSSGENYTSIGGQWVVPTVKAPQGMVGGFSAAWIGIGGACLDSQCSSIDRTLIQIGTEQDTAHGSSQYLAWYEMLPDASITITSLPISPGDQVKASIKMLNGNPGGPQSWQLSLTNVTTGQSWNKMVEYQSSLASADWIVEAPFGGGQLPLADFGSMFMDPVEANGGDPRLSSAQQTIMLNPYGQIANVSAPDPKADGFNVCFGTATDVPTTCTAPST